MPPSHNRYRITTEKSRTKHHFTRCDAPNSTKERLFLAISNIASLRVPNRPLAEAATFLLLLGMSADTLAAQANRCVLNLDDHTLAQAHAPIYLFSKDESYFPTLHAFGDLWRSDSPSNSFFDLAGPSWLLDDTRPVTSWRARNAEYLELDYARRRKAIVYRVDRDVEVDAVWQYLATDQRAWNRLWRHLRRKPPQEMTFDVIRYFAYYLADEGLIGHEHDVETVSVFLARPPLDLRIIVGAGHGAGVPNNVLVLGGGAHPASNQNILVELGDHASAPDVPPHGEFEIGSDVNWHVERVWGVRDVQSSAGSGWSGQWNSSMMRKRDTATAPRMLPIHMAQDSGGLAGDNVDFYALLPGEFMGCLQDTYRSQLRVEPLKLEAEVHRSAPTEAELRRSRLPVEFSMADLWGLHESIAIDLGTDSLAAATFAAALAWDQSLDQILNHELYEQDNAGDVFKSHLFAQRSRPFHVGVAYAAKADEWSIHSAFLLVPTLPVGLPGHVEFQLDFGTSANPKRLDLRLIYERDYYALITWYGGLGMSFTTDTTTSTTRHASLGIGLLPQALWSRPSTKWLLPLEPLRLSQFRFGLRTPFDKRGPQFGDTGWEFSIRLWAIIRLIGHPTSADALITR